MQATTETEPLSLEDKGWSLLKDKRHRQGLMVRLTEWLSMDGPQNKDTLPIWDNRDFHLSVNFKDFTKGFIKKGAN